MSPWWSFTGLKKRLGRFQFLILLTALVLTVAYAGFQTGQQVGVWQQDKIQVLEQRLDSLYQEIERKNRQINYLMVELEVEQNASSQVQLEIKQLREESFTLTKELNFYQKVVAPELVAEGLAIDQFAVEATNRAKRYKFQFALVQTDSKKRNAKGNIQLTLHGAEQEQVKSLDLAKLASLKKDDLRFSFHYFQYFEGEFSLDEGFIPEAIEIKVVQPKTRWQPYKSFSQKLDWPKGIN